MKGLNIINLVINILIILGIVYIIQRFRNKRSVSGLAPVPEPAFPPIVLRALNHTQILREGDTNSEVVALQLMLKHYFPDQIITGHLDADTYIRMRSITAGISDGLITLHDFSGRFFRPKYGEKAWKEIVNSFPKL